MRRLIDITAYPVSDVLNVLLLDKSDKTGTNKYNNIIWATGDYSEYGEDFCDTAYIKKAALLEYPDIICPRTEKSLQTQTERTRKKAEVFTPSWVCNKMNNYMDADWFGRENVFNTENGDGTWNITKGKIEFPKHKSPEDYIGSRRLEITCGEAPFLAGRYDVAAGELIPVSRRIGVLDRKLRIVNETAQNYSDWLKLVARV